MGFVGDLISGDKGMGYQAQGLNFQDYISGANINPTLGKAESGLAQQQSLIDALKAQNGIQNQSDVFAQQQALAQQLQGVANGTGPNPAQAQLAQATGANTANQAALMASQRGAGQNVGLIARQAAQQGAGIQQQAAGQAATLQAQQQFNALGALQNQQAQMGSLAGQQVGQYSNAISGYNQGAQSLLQSMYNAMAQQNQARVGALSSQNSANASVNTATANQQGQLLGGALGGAGAAMGLAHGGMVPPVHQYAEGGDVLAPQSPSGAAPAPDANTNYASKPRSFVGQHLNSKFASAFNQTPSAEGGALSQGMTSFGAGLGKAIGSLFASSASGGQGGGGSMDAGSSTQMGSAGPLSQAAKDYKDGGKVPGKAKVAGDSLKNDVVPALLSSGEIVLPRSVTQSKNPVEDAAKFVAAVLKHHGKKKETSDEA